MSHTVSHSVLSHPPTTYRHPTCQSNALENEPHECTLCLIRTLENPSVPDAFNDVFSTNDPPNDALLMSLRTSLNAFRSLLAQMEKHLALMDHAKDMCAVSMKKYEAAVHPIRSLPDDILLTIFRWHITSEADMSLEDDSLCSSLSPWTLSQVSRRWRALTLSSPLLWSAIKIRPRPKREIPYMRSRWDLVIERSADCGLVVDIDDVKYYRFKGEPSTSVTESVRLISWTTTRWRVLDIYATHHILPLLSGCSYERLAELICNLESSGRPVYVYERATSQTSNSKGRGAS